MSLNKLKSKKILILGFGQEGQDTFLFLRKLFPNKILGIGDRIKYQISNIKNQKSIRKDKKIKWHLGKNYLKALKNYDVIIKSPGIPSKIFAPYLIKKQRVTSQTEIFFENCPGKIIGVTGTKGKSTTAALIYKILRDGGLKVHLVGNIGKPVLNLLFSAAPKDIYVYELSSFQLHNLKKSPHIAVFLNVYPEHLDYYRNFKEYVKAKANITKYQTGKDYLIYNAQDPIVKKIAQKSKAQKIPFSPTNYEFKRITNKINLKINKAPLAGNFNFKNIIPAIIVVKIFKISQKDIIKAIKNFKPLPHRLEFVGTFKGIKFYNDSLSTIPEATIEALDYFSGDVQTLILGGFDRGLSFKNLAKRIVKSNVKTLILFPATGERILKEIKKQKPTEREPFSACFVKNMREVVKLVYLHTDKGKVCLLSPASPSFGIFKDYRERGNQFKKYIKLNT